VGRNANNLLESSALPHQAIGAHYGAPFNVLSASHLVPSTVDATGLEEYMNGSNDSNDTDKASMSAEPPRYLHSLTNVRPADSAGSNTYINNKTDARHASSNAMNSNLRTSAALLSTPAPKLPEETRSRLLHVHREATRGCDAMYWAASLLIGAFEHYRDAEGGLSLPSFVQMCSDLGMVPSNLTYAHVREKFLAACPKGAPIADYTSMITCLRILAESAFGALGGDAASHLMARMRAPPSLPSYFSHAAAQERDVASLASVQPHCWDVYNNNAGNSSSTSMSNAAGTNHYFSAGQNSLLQDQLQRGGSFRGKNDTSGFFTDSSFDFNFKGLGADMDLDGALKQIAAEHARYPVFVYIVCA
jgi:hypothetical protein